MNRTKKRNNSSQNIEEIETYTINTEPTEAEIQYSIQWLTQLWKDLGIEGTPDREEVLNPTKTELMTVLLMRKYNI